MSHSYDDSKIRLLEAAVDSVLAHNFDTVTQSCFITILKLLDNAIQKPNQPKFRSVNLSNDTIRTKIGNAKGGIEVLLASGFEHAKDASLVLPLQYDVQRLVTARRLLASRCIQELKCRPDDLPKYIPPAVVAATKPHVAFNPYSAQRFDALSASVGQTLGPDANYKSHIETQVERLERQKKTLQGQSKRVDRQWHASRPGETTIPTITTMQDDGRSNNDMSLLAAKALSQTKEPVGFTTSNMRKLAKLKQTKVYDFTMLRMCLPSGETITAKFRPDETIATVIAELKIHCLVMSVDFVLVAPPRTVLDETLSLEAAQLVPAAKLTIRWKTNQSSSIRPELFQTNDSVAFPTGSLIVDGSTSTSSSTVPTKKTKPSEEELMQRMMGKKIGLGQKSSSKPGNTKPTGVPKWFKK